MGCNAKSTGTHATCWYCFGPTEDKGGNLIPCNCATDENDKLRLEILSRRVEGKHDAA